MSIAESKRPTIQRETDFAATREAVLRGLAAHNEARVGPRNAEPWRSACATRAGPWSAA